MGKYNFNSRIQGVSNSLAKKRLLEKSPDTTHESFYNEDNIWNVNLPFVTTIYDFIMKLTTLGSNCTNYFSKS